MAVSGHSGRVVLFFMGFVGAFPAEVRVSMPSVGDVWGVQNAASLTGQSTFEVADEVVLRPNRGSLLMVLGKIDDPQSYFSDDDVPSENFYGNDSSQTENESSGAGLFEVGKMSARAVVDRVCQEILDECLHVGMQPA